ncbi:hypothetical protein [Rhodohalobacter halophilus]|uniref:hypothetical protein n=1 Tax=Rhodohalobacter halophilus TaxID=1812810 RepID=UPI00083FA49F|nr:hypothetical protein [Rhodohalobacter halophilus]
MNNSSVSNLTNKEIITKGSRPNIAAFLLLFFIPLFISCESPGSVGEGLGPDGSTVEKDEYSVDSITPIEANTFSGRLQSSAMGYLEDPVYGTLNAIAVLKPALSSSVVDTLKEGDTMSLRLVFNESVYGEDGSVANFELFEMAERWRGNEIRYNQPASVDLNAKVGEFQIANEDTVEVELSADWVDKYRSYFNSESANVDSLYAREFFGLAVVPAETNSKIRFLRHTPQDDEDTAITEFQIHTTELDEDEEEVEVVGPVALRDWGSFTVRSDEPEYTSGYVLHNIGQIMEVDLDLNTGDLGSKNIVNASLIFTVDRSDEEMHSNILRPEVETIRAHTFSNPPADLISEIFISSPNYGADLNEDEDLFKVDVTQYVLDRVYGESNTGPLYFSVQTVNGTFYSVKLNDDTAAESRRPRLIITSVE